MLGDDIVIRGQTHALCYREIITDLGIEIQKLKTISGSAAEFCKRHFYKGIEVSPVPIKLLASTCKAPLLINSLVDKLRERSSIERGLPPAFLDSMLNVIGRNPSEVEHLRTIVGNPITGWSLYDTTRKWLTADRPPVSPDDFQILYSLTKYEYLVRQYSLLQHGEEIFVTKLLQTVLPGVLQDCNMRHHPYISSLQIKYAAAKSSSHKSIGKFWSASKIERGTLPTIPRLSTRMLKASYRQRMKHSARIILLFYKKVKTLIQREHKDQYKLRHLLGKGLLVKRALIRNRRTHIIRHLLNRSFYKDKQKH
jgi:hypothetical protein